MSLFLEPERVLLDTLEEVTSKVPVLAAHAQQLRTLLAGVTSITSVEEPDPEIGLITIRRPHQPSASSRKLANLVLNWRKLFQIIPDVTLASLGAAALPLSAVWSLPLAVLYALNKMCGGMTEELDDVEATALVTLWRESGARARIPEELGFRSTCAFREEAGLQPISASRFSAAIDRLARLHCIDLHDGDIVLRESVHIHHWR